MIGHNIFQREDIPSSNVPVFGLGHDMGRFPPYIKGSTKLLHHFLGSKKSQTGQKYDVMY